ncbi:MAG: RNA 3'-terminal phosphate cyclase [Candidatus Heimdallarchaeota archaeon]
MIQEIKKEISNNSAVDEFMADQLIFPLALSQKGSSITIPSITEHVRGNLELIQLILGDRIKIEKTTSSVRLTRI